MTSWMMNKLQRCPPPSLLPPSYRAVHRPTESRSLKGDCKFSASAAQHRKYIRQRRSAGLIWSLRKRVPSERHKERRHRRSHIMFQLNPGEKNTKRTGGPGDDILLRPPPLPPPIFFLPDSFPLISLSSWQRHPPLVTGSAITMGVRGHALSVEHFVKGAHERTQEAWHAARCKRTASDYKCFVILVTHAAGLCEG